MNMKNLVKVIEGKGFTDSRAIAVEFGKRHDIVLRAIRESLQDLPKDFQQRNFTEVEIIETNAIGGPVNKSYYRLSRDGFVFTVMGFIGKKAAVTKILFIEEFNRMESKLIDIGLQAKPLSVEDLLRMTSSRLQESVDYAADHALEHGLPSAKILKLYPAQSVILINEAKPKVKDLTKYGLPGLLTIGLKDRGITTKISVTTKFGKPAKLFNAKEIHEFMAELKEVN